MEDSSKPDTSEILNLPKENLTLEGIRQDLTVDERLWLARMVQAHGEAEVLAMWPSYEVQINFARSFSDAPTMPAPETGVLTAEPTELTPEDSITILKESVLRLPPSLRSKAALEKRARTDREVEEMTAQGLMIDIPFLLSNRC